MNILDALSQQKPKHVNGRILCDDGLLSVSDAVFECTLYQVGYDCIDEFMDDIPLDKRHFFLKQEQI